jgi:hypothetical protein
MVGMFYMCIHCCALSDDSCDCGGRSYCLNFWPYPMFPYSPAAVGSGTTGGDCACCCINCGDCMGASSAGGGTGCCGSGECATAFSGLGSEAAGCLLGLVVIFAVIGVFVCVVLGVIYAQYVFQKHLHVLQKFTLARDYIVADLAESDIEMANEKSVELQTIPEESKQRNLTAIQQNQQENSIEFGMINSSLVRSRYSPLSTCENDIIVNRTDTEYIHLSHQHQHRQSWRELSPEQQAELVRFGLS